MGQYDPVQEHYDEPYMIKDAEELQHYFVTVHNSVNAANSEEPSWGGGEWTVSQMQEHYRNTIGIHKYNDIRTGLSEETGESDVENVDLWMPSLFQSLLFSAYAGPQDETVPEGKDRLSSFRFVLSNLGYIIPPKYQQQWLQKAEESGIQNVIDNISTRQTNFDAVVQLHNAMKDIATRGQEEWESKDIKERLMEGEIYASCRSCNQIYGFEKEFCNKDVSTCPAERCLVSRALFA